MADPNAKQKPQYSQIDPLLSGKFWIEIQGIVEGYFTECTGLHVETEYDGVRRGRLERIRSQSCRSGLNTPTSP